MQKELIKQKHVHGGAHSIGKRKTTRPLSTKRPIHFTLRSEYAYGTRSLLKYKMLIDKMQKKWGRYFNIRIYRYAVCGNHVHFLIKGKNRIQIQNFFRVFAGHLAQEVLRNSPITADERIKRGDAPAPKKRDRKFWKLLIFTRVLTWGRDFKNVMQYILQNVLEANGAIKYKIRAVNKKTQVDST